MLTNLARSAWLVCIFAFVACGNSPTAPSPPASDLAAQFDSLWTRFDLEYSYFEHKRIDWPATRATYRPRALAAADQRAFIDVIREMLGTLHDGHVMLRDPSGAQIPTFRPQVFANWDRVVFDRYRSRAGWTQGQLDWGHGQLNGIPYIAIGGWGSQAIRTADFDAAFERYRGAPAMILDVRMNQGGNDQLAFEIAGRFTQSIIRAGYVRFRNGPAHTDFGPPIDRTVSPRGPWQFAGNVLLLIGSRCASSNESFIMAMGEMPNVMLVGDRTAGSTGNPGTFPLAEGWSYTVSRWIEYTPGNQVIEDNGIVPDVIVPVTESDFASGRDPVLEWALARLAGERSNP
jgi:carboxyl-terminal processing protease